MATTASARGGTRFAALRDVHWELLDIRGAGDRGVTHFRMTGTLGGVPVEQAMWQPSSCETRRRSGGPRRTERDARSRGRCGRSRRPSGSRCEALAYRRSPSGDERRTTRHVAGRMSRLLGPFTTPTTRAQQATRAAASRREDDRRFGARGSVAEWGQGDDRAVFEQLDEAWRTFGSRSATTANSVQRVKRSASHAAPGPVSIEVASDSGRVRTSWTRDLSPRHYTIGRLAPKPPGCGSSSMSQENVVPNAKAAPLWGPLRSLRNGGT